MAELDNAFVSFRKRFGRPLPVAAKPIGQVHVALPKPLKVGHSPTNPSCNMQYELLITQYDNNYDEINQQAIDILRIVPQWYGVSMAG